MSDRSPSGTQTDSSLAGRLRARIKRSGPLTFAAFMDAALYDPEAGFYARPAVGPGGEFVTSPHVSPVFGVLLARQVEQFWELLDRPRSFAVVEVGAGDGTLAGQILESLPEGVRRSADYVAVERSEQARTSLRNAGLAVEAELAGLPGGLEGCILANELLDNLPFHRLRVTHTGPVELYVDRHGDRFVVVEGPLSDPVLGHFVPPLPAGAEWVVRPAARAFVDQIPRVLARGYAWIDDYALSAGAAGASVHGYRAQRLEEDVLSDPGSRDITAGVDFDALAAHARERGMSAWGPVTQRDALLALGFRDLDRRAQSRQVQAVGGRQGIEALRIYSNRSRANLLLAKGGLGDFAVLCLGVGTDEPPLSVRVT